MNLLRLIGNRARDESGMALVMAIGISMVLAIAGSSLVLYSISNENHADRSRSDLRSYNLAQTGLENAVSTIANAGPLARATQAILSDGSSTCPAQSFGSGESVSWCGRLYDDDVVHGTPDEPGFEVPDWRWHVWADSTVPDPNVAGGAVKRHLEADIRLVPRDHQVPSSEAWRYIYSKEDQTQVPGDPHNPENCDMTLDNNPNVDTSFYVTGDLCLVNNSQIVLASSAPANEVIVHGYVTQFSPQNDIGTDARRLQVAVAQNCKYRNAPSQAECNQVQHIWDPDGGAEKSPVTIPPPNAPFTTWRNSASPGPTSGCDPEQSSGPYPNFEAPMGTFQPDQMASFVCKTKKNGEFSWNASTHELTISGTAFVEGNLEFESGNVIKYNGVGAIYTSGWSHIRQTALCAQRTGSGCDPDTTTWNTEQNMLLIASNGTPNVSGCPSCSILIEQSAQWQGALYAAGNIGLQNQSWTQGPMVAGHEIMGNQFSFAGMPSVVRVPFGTPGTVIDEWEVVPPTNYTG